MEPEIYKVTSFDADGRSIVVYVMPAMRRLVSRSMAEEHGNVEVEPMMLADVPEGVLPTAEQE
jgi:hypothetical protein